MRYLGQSARKSLVDYLSLLYCIVESVYLSAKTTGDAGALLPKALPKMPSYFIWR